MLILPTCSSYFPDREVITILFNKGFYQEFDLEYYGLGVEIGFQFTNEFLYIENFSRLGYVTAKGYQFDSDVEIKQYTNSYLNGFSTSLSQKIIQAGA